MHQRFVRGIRYVPTLPTVLGQILSLLNDERSSAGDLERMISHDQALSSKVLAVANSAYYGFRHKVLTVRRAVVALGYEEIRNLCLGASLMGFLHPSTFRDKDGAEQLWLHSLAVAEATKILAKRTESVDVETAYTAGLLHDLGKVVLAAFFPDEVEAIGRLKETEGLSYRQAEKAQGADHAQVGKALGQHWELPPPITETLGYHHDIISGLSYYELVGCVHVADYLVRDLEMGFSGNPDPPTVRHRVLDHLKISQEVMDACRADMDEQRESISSLWETLIKL